MNQRKRYWGCAAGWMLLIYVSLYFVRPICDFLKGSTPFTLIINLGLAGVLSALAFWMIIRQKSSLLAVFLTVGLVGMYALGLVLLSIPEEKIHFVEYGILAVLIHRAFIVDAPALKAFVLAWIAASFIGWGDELIQGWLPNRYYQTKDIVLNSVSALLGLCWIAIFRWGRRVS